MQVRITLKTEVAQALYHEAARLELTLEDLLSRIVQQRLSDLIPGAPTEWMPRERWEALLRGEGCLLCAAIACGEYADAYGYTVADLSLSRLRLASNQSVPGYCVLICKKHVAEPYHLNPEERPRYFEDLMRAAQAIERAFKPIKMNLEMLGNMVPHLHCHIKPRFYGDAAPGAPIHPDKAPLFLAPREYDERVRLIRRALELQL